MKNFDPHIQIRVSQVGQVSSTDLCVPECLRYAETSFKWRLLIRALVCFKYRQVIACKAQSAWTRANVQVFTEAVEDAYELSTVRSIECFSDTFERIAP